MGLCGDSATQRQRYSNLWSLSHRQPTAETSQHRPLVFLVLGPHPSPHGLSAILKLKYGGRSRFKIICDFREPPLREISDFVQCILKCKDKCSSYINFCDIASSCNIVKGGDKALRILWDPSRLQF